jgi:hypothetical protein
MNGTKPTGKGRAHPLFPDRVGIAPAEEVSNPECWLPHAVGRAVSERVWRNAGGEYQDDGVLVVEPGVNLDDVELDLLGYVEGAKPEHDAKGV